VTRGDPGVPADGLWEEAVANGPRKWARPAGPVVEDSITPWARSRTGGRRAPPRSSWRWPRRPTIGEDHRHRRRHIASSPTCWTLKPPSRPPGAGRTGQGFAVVDWRGQWRLPDQSKKGEPPKVLVASGLGEITEGDQHRGCVHEEVTKGCGCRRPGRRKARRGTIKTLTDTLNQLPRGVANRGRLGGRRRRARPRSSRRCEHRPGNPPEPRAIAPGWQPLKTSNKPGKSSCAWSAA